jgi:hypothetical protein
MPEEEATNYKITEVTSTGATSRDMTDAEKLDVDNRKTRIANENKAIEDAATAKAEKKASGTNKLKALGLTDDEIAALTS